MNENTYRLVYAKHDGCLKDFLFSVPPNIILHKGDVLLVDTVMGPTVAVATSEPFVSADINGLATKLGAYLPLKHVLQAAGSDIQSYITRRARNDIRNTVDFLDTTKSDEKLPY